MAITLNTKVYNFAGFVQNISRYWNREAGYPSGFLALTAKIDDATVSAPFKVRWKLKLPTVASTNDDCTCAGQVINEVFADIVVTVPATSSQAERDAIATSVKDLTATPEFQASVKALAVPSA